MTWGDIMRDNNSKREMLEYVGNINQICSIREFQLKSGKKENLNAAEIRNGTGLNFTVLLDRAMDIFDISFKGMNISYYTSSGIVSPQYFSEMDNGFINTWHGGFLTTCGLTYAGLPCEDNGEKLPIHGVIDNIPAEETYCGMEWENGIPVMKIRGKLIQGRHGAERITMTREIICRYGENKIFINDKIENDGFTRTPLMLIYHFNMGYPILNENSYLLVDAISSEGREECAKKGIDDCYKFQKPTQDYEQQSFYNDMKTDMEGNTKAALINPDKELGLAIRYNKKQLKMMVHLKQMLQGNYFATIEPCNAGIEGRAAERDLGRLEYIEPGEIRNFNMTIEILNGKEQIINFEKEF